MSERFDYIKVGIASPERILGWSRGEVTKPETINYRTLKPERDGLFCERIFGPAKDWECHCGKYKRVRHKGIICERCGVEVTDSKVRRYRMGHIKLAAPVAHIWYLKGIPSYMSILLDIPLRALEDVVYFNSYIVLDPGNTNLEKKQTISEEEFENISSNPDAEFTAEMGAAAIKQLLEEMDLPAISAELKAEITNTTGQKRAKAIKRLRVVDSFIGANSQPSWMIMDAVPVIPPDLRPMVQLDGGRFATSDLNDLYRRVINRNNRLYRLNEMGAPDIIIRNEMRMLQEAVDALIDNGRRGRAVVGPNNRPLKSLSDIIEGKQGRFRQNLLGKRVDYSGRSVIVVGPYLKLHQCGLPKEMALELFKPFVMNKLVDRGIVQNIKSAKKKIERGETIVWDILEEVIKGHPVMLNRAPTLHRLGIQAFEPVLVEGRAIQIHPLVCTAFNADFDGDQMAVHVPLSVEAQTEARLLMLASNNVLSPATGRPIITPTQDMVLGCYYLTVDNPDSPKAETRFYKDFDDVLAAFSQNLIGIHTKVAIRWSGDRIENITPDYYRDFTEDEKAYVTKKLVNRSVLVTTPGRIILNATLPESFPFYNKEVNRKELERIIMRAFQTLGSAEAADLADALKALGFRYATRSGISIAIQDLHVPQEKKKILEDAENEIEKSRRAYLRGEITEVERYSKVIDTWAEATNDLTEMIKEKYDRLNSVYMMAFSGARGNISQVRQLVGMRGLMADPSGRIIDLPIKSNFQEGLTVTEYIISSYGARKGLVDTALRTADSGYLTRRLADVAQDVIVSEDDCGTDQHLHLTSIKDGDAVVVPLTDRAIGRVLSDHLVHSKTGEIILEAGTMITPENVGKIMEAEAESIPIRSPLTCHTKHGICRKCYGWSLTNNQLVDIGEAVGIIAAQSIGEPGTQLTMRTFHTGGVFTKSNTTTLLKAKNAGTIELPEDLSTREFRTKHGNIILITDKETVVTVKGAKKAQHITVPVGFEIKVKQGDTISAGGVVAESFLETGRTTRKSIEKGYKDISSETSGSVEFVGFFPEEKRDRQGNITKTANRSGVIWVLSGDVYTLPAGAKVLVQNGQRINANDVLAETRMVSEYGGTVRLGADVVTENLEDGRMVITSGRELSVVTADLRLEGCEVIPGKKEPILKYGDSLYALKVKEGARIETDTVLAESVDENWIAPMGGEVRFLEVSLVERKLINKPSKLLFIPEERIVINKDVSLLNEGYYTGKPVEAGEEVVKDVTVTTNGILEVVVDNNIIREVIVYNGEHYEVAKDVELSVAADQYVPAGQTLAPGIVAKQDGVVKLVDLEGDNRLVIIRAASVVTIDPAEKEIPFVGSTEDISLRFITKMLVKDGEKVRAGISFAKTEVVIKIGGRLANLAGRLELMGGCPAITILESLSLRRDVPILAHRTELREQVTPTFLLVGDGEVIEPGTTVIRTEIYSHAKGIINRPSTEDNRRLLLITSEQEATVPVTGTLKVEEGSFVHEGSEIADGVNAPATGKIRLESGKAVIRTARPYLISAATQLLADVGSMVVRGEPLATLVYDRVKTGDIIQGLPRVEELLEARKPKESALISQYAGRVRLISDPEEATKVFIVTSDNGEVEYPLPPGSRLIVNDGDMISAGDLLTDGPVNPHDVLLIQGVEAVQRYLVNEVQMVYRSQGVEIADKHIEVIVRQMTRKMKVDDPGDSTLLPGELVDVLDVNAAKNVVLLAEGTAPDVHPVLLGITKASLNTESFVSAASFQETTRVLTEAAIEGKRDWLRGLKENVVIGRLIPAGTGFFDQGEEVAEELVLPSPSPELIGQ